MHAILIGKPATPYVDVLSEKLTTDWVLECIDDGIDNAGAAELFKKTDTIISNVYNDTFPASPNLKLLQAPVAGLDRIIIDSVPVNAAICNAFGHQIPVAEYCIMGMLVTAHQLFQIDREFRGGNWLWTKTLKFPTHNEVYGKTVCIVGLGKIGLQIADRAKALGMRVTGVSRSIKSGIKSIEKTGTYAELDDFLPDADFLILACPLSDETKDLIDDKKLALMKRSSVIINIARGPVVSETELYDSLKDGKIAAAVLDVWYQYPDNDESDPRPSQYPFHELDNVIMTPHLSAWSEEMVHRRWGEVAANLDSIVTGKPLVNVVRDRP